MNYFHGIINSVAQVFCIVLLSLSLSVTGAQNTYPLMLNPYAANLANTK